MVCTEARAPLHFNANNIRTRLEKLGSFFL